MQCFIFCMIWEAVFIEVIAKWVLLIQHVTQTISFSDSDLCAGAFVWQMVRLKASYSRKKLFTKSNSFCIDTVDCDFYFRIDVRVPLTLMKHALLLSFRVWAFSIYHVPSTVLSTGHISWCWMPVTFLQRIVPAVTPLDEGQSCVTARRRDRARIITQGLIPDAMCQTATLLLQLIT